jgi:hypothetical protein
MRYGHVFLIALVVCCLPADRTSAQVLRATAGAVGGLIAGVVVTTGTVVLEARMGRYMYSLDDMIALRPEVIPVFVGPVVGAVLGARSPDALGRAGIGAAVGLAGGIVIGAVVGSAIWPAPEGRWAGGIVGGAAGMLVGSILYASLGNGGADESPEPAATFAVRLPVGGRR